MPTTNSEAVSLAKIIPQLIESFGAKLVYFSFQEFNGSYAICFNVMRDKQVWPIIISCKPNFALGLGAAKARLLFKINSRLGNIFLK